MKNPLITVIVPVYKTEQYLTRCVESIRDQTYTNLEIILVDDGSPDRCGEMCDAFAEADQRIKVIHKENGGQASARNCALDIMKGEYVGFVDSDDWVQLDMYEKLMTMIQKHNCEIACGGMEFTDDNGHISYLNEQVQDYQVMDVQTAYKELGISIRITDCMCDKLFHSSVFDQLRFAEGMIYEDFDLIHRCIAQAKSVAYTAEPFYCYYMSQDSTTRSTFKVKQFDFAKAGKNRLDFYVEHSPQNYKYALSRYLTVSLDILWRSHTDHSCKKERSRFIRELKKYIKDCPEVPMTRNTRIKLWALQLGFPVYVAFMSCVRFVSQIK